MWVWSKLWIQLPVCRKNHCAIFQLEADDYVKLHQHYEIKKIQIKKTLKEISPGCSLEGLMLKLKLQYLPPNEKSWLIGKDPDAGRDWGQEEKGATEDEMAGWHHQLNAHEFEWTPGVGDGQGGLACCDSWGCRVGHDWATELNWILSARRRVRLTGKYF